MLFFKWKRSQINTQYDKKKQKIPEFNRFYAIFIKFLIDSVDYNVETIKQGTNSLSNSYFEEMNVVFNMKKTSN